MTITITADNHKLPQRLLGETIKVKSYKRWLFMVTGVDATLLHCHQLTAKGFYNPAPKSRLRNRSVFSKFKIPHHI